MIDPRLALDAIGQLPDLDLDLAVAALQLARVDQPDADWQAVQGHLSDLARDAVTASYGIGDDLGARAAALGGILVGRYGYAGDRESYDDMANANLIQVIQRRRGLPVALGILWLHCARAAGWDAHGVNFPGHFLIALGAGSNQLVVDVFDGGETLDIRALRQLIKSVEGADAELRPGLLQPMSDRAVLMRLQNNIMLRRLQNGDLAGALAATEDMLRVDPGAAPLWRDAAVLHQRLEQVAAALRCYQRFLALVPRGEAADEVRAIIDGLRAQLN